MADIFGSSKDAIQAEIEKKIERESFLTMVLEGAKDENINQAAKEGVVRLIGGKKA